MKKTVCIIGAGIHGLTSAISLAKAGFDVTIVEKNGDILLGTSGSTHNRAHVGYHYPRSKETARECYEGLQYFKEKFPTSLSFPKDVYYLIAKDSKTSTENYKKFCDDLNYPYELIMPDNEFLIQDHIDSSFKVSEPVFDILNLKVLFRNLIKELNIKLLTFTELLLADTLNGGYVLTCDQKILKNTIHFYTDIIVNATYAYSNNILKILDLEEDMTEYNLQHTEVIIVRSEKYVPSLTVMDGPYVSLMPYANQPNLYLLYDVFNSVIEKNVGYYIKERTQESNAKKMLEHCSKYFPFKLEFVNSLYGSRPVPTSSITNAGDCRKTRIKCHVKHPHIYSILEGKFISSPMIAENITTLIKNNL